MGHYKFVNKTAVRVTQFRFYSALNVLNVLYSISREPNELCRLCIISIRIRCLILIYLMNIPMSQFVEY